MSDLVIQPARSLKGTLSVPSDKSISHRALLIGAIAQGTTRIRQILRSGDLESTRRVLEGLGVSIQGEGDLFTVQGRGLRGLKQPAGPLNMGNSGTTTRLLLGILAGHPFTATLTGDASLSNRPMRRVTEPLIRMGASIEGPNGLDRLPLTIRGGELKGIDVTLAVASAQVKSALLLAGLYANGPTTITEPIATRDHTERMLKYFGAQLTCHPRPGMSSSRKRGSPFSGGLSRAGSSEDQWAITIEPGSPLQARELTIPGDISSAAFFLVAAAIVPGSSITVKGVGLNPTRTGILDLLTRMGTSLKGSPARHDRPIAAGGGRPGTFEAWEPVGDVTVKSSRLRGITVEPSMIPHLVDELPILMVAATQAEGRTVIREASELRVKETDRIQSMVTGLTALGAKIRAEGDSIFIEGPTPLKGAKVRSFGDHRTAMALAVSALVAEGPTTIEEAEWIDISYPGFFPAVKSVLK